MASIRFDKIEKNFGKTKVIHSLGFDIADGEFVVLVGPSGCGKSTLLRMLAGLEETSGGEISIDGRVINELDSKVRDIAMVFQSYALYPHMTVRDNMALSLKLRKADAAQIEQIGTPLQLFDRPVNQFVAQFIGSPSINLIEGKFTRSDSGDAVDALGHRWPVSGPVDVEEGREVVLDIGGQRLVTQSSKSTPALVSAFG